MQPHKNFMSLHQGGYEITGGQDVGPKPLVSEGLINRHAKGE